MPGAITIIIADDCDAYRKAFAHLLGSGQLQVAATVGNGAELIEATKQYLPDLVFIDIRMPVMDGIAACRELQNLFPSIGKIALTMYDHYYPDVQQMLQAGARGFLTKDAGVDEMIRCIKTVYSGGTYYCGSCRPIVNALLKGEAAHHLADHEMELLRLIGEELNSEDIAARLHKSVHTIGAWRQELLLKCGAKNVAGLIKFGIKHGIIKV
jgi:two-component system NarL family response regulator